MGIRGLSRSIAHSMQASCNGMEGMVMIMRLDTRYKNFSDTNYRRLVQSPMLELWQFPSSCRYITSPSRKPEHR